MPSFGGNPGNRAPAPRPAARSAPVRGGGSGLGAIARIAGGVSHATQAAAHAIAHQTSTPTAVSRQLVSTLAHPATQAARQAAPAVQAQALRQALQALFYAPPDSTRYSPPDSTFPGGAEIPYPDASTPFASPPDFGHPLIPADPLRIPRPLPVPAQGGSLPQGGLPLLPPTRPDSLGARQPQGDPRWGLTRTMPIPLRPNAAGSKPRAIPTSLVRQGGSWE